MSSQKYRKKKKEKKRFVPSDKNDQICTTALYMRGYILWFSYAFKVCSKSVSEIRYMMMMNCFCCIVDQQKEFSLISSQDHCQRSSPLQISNMPRTGFEPAQNLSSGLAEWSCTVVITTTPCHHIHPVIVVVAVIMHKLFNAGKKHLSEIDGQLKVFLDPCGLRNLHQINLMYIHFSHYTKPPKCVVDAADIRKTLDVFCIYFFGQWFVETKLKKFSILALWVCEQFCCKMLV